MTEITPDQLDDRLADNDDDVFILDIRQEDEYEAWHVPGSENIPVYEILKEDPKAADPALSAVPKDKEIVTVCAAGVLSQKATDRLREMGYDAKTLVDGMKGWSRVHRSAPVGIDIDGTLVQVARPGKGCLSHVLISDGEAAVYDPSQYVSEYEAIVDEYDAELVGVFDTHAHADHVSGGRRLADRHGIPYYLHPDEAEGLDAAALTDGQTFDIGTVHVRVVHTPGHSPGGVTFEVENEALLTGDTLFHESVGRVELGVTAGIERTSVSENASKLYESLQRLRERDDNPMILPAHDPGSPDPAVVARLTDIERNNEDLRRDRSAFVNEIVSNLPEHPPNFQQIKRVNTGVETAAAEELSSLERGPNRCAAE